MNISKAASEVLSVRHDLFVLSMLTFASSLILGSLQWRMLLKIVGIDLRLRRAISFYFVGAFFNNFLPANIGGDVIRAYDVYKDSGKINQSAAATLTDRLFGMIALGLLAVPCGIYIAFRHTTFGLTYSDGLRMGLMTLGFILLLIFVVFLLFNKDFARRFERIFQPLIRIGGRQRLKDIYQCFEIYGANIGKLLPVVAIALVVQVLRVLVHYEISLAMGLDIDIIYFYLFIPIIAIFIALPISIGGLGVREGLGLILFCRVVDSLSGEQAVTMEFLAYVVGILVSLAGGMIYLRRSFIPYRVHEDVSDGGQIDDS